VRRTAAGDRFDRGATRGSAPVSPPAEELEQPWTTKGTVMQLTDVLEFVEATLDRLSLARAQELARQVASGEGRESATRLAQDLVDWSQRNRDRIREIVQREVAAQVSAVGVATKADIEALETRVRRLERSAARPAKRSGAGTTKTTARKSTAKKATSSSTTPGHETRTGPPLGPSGEKSPRPGGEGTGA
jgi:polyhydroxyalkanoate synthesis regulator phasin